MAEDSEILYKIHKFCVRLMVLALYQSDSCYSWPGVRVGNQSSTRSPMTTIPFIRLIAPQLAVWNRLDFSCIRHKSNSGSWFVAAFAKNVPRCGPSHLSIVLSSDVETQHAQQNIQKNWLMSFYSIETPDIEAAGKNLNMWIAG